MTPVAAFTAWFAGPFVGPKGGVSALAGDG